MNFYYKQYNFTLLNLITSRNSGSDLNNFVKATPRHYFHDLIIGLCKLENYKTSNDLNTDFMQFRTRLPPIVLFISSHDDSGCNCNELDLTNVLYFLKINFF